MKVLYGQRSVGSVVACLLTADSAPNDTGIEARLATLEQAVRDLCTQTKAISSSVHPKSIVAFEGSTENERAEALPEGSSSFSRQTLEAAGVEELVSSVTSRSSTIMLELENLRSLANSRGVDKSPGNSYRSGEQSNAPLERELPPVGLVLQVLRELRESQGMRRLPRNMTRLG